MQTPKLLTGYLKKAKELLDKGAVREVDFSNGTYRIEVLDSGSFWPFLRIDSHGNVIDAFCHCAEFESENQCLHLAACYLEVFQNEKEPLHIRFEKSFWREFFLIYAEKSGFEVQFKKLKNGYSHDDFFIHFTNKEGEKNLKPVFENRIQETEENSIKFSNLTSQEIQDWKENKPSKDLRFELSIWADLAKQILVYQENGIHMNVQFKGKNIPNQIEAVIDGYHFKSNILSNDWKRLIPKLNTISSNLKVYQFGESALESIHYDPESMTLFFNKKKKEVSEKKEEKYTIDGWEFIPNEGFYSSKEDELNEEKITGKQKIQEFLSDHLDLLQNYLKDTPITAQVHPVQYHLFFDNFSNLHIEAYLEKPKDFKEAQIFGDWAYLPQKGFFRITPLLFSTPEKIISKYEVSEFVNIHREWLHQFEGFQTHFQSLPSTLTFHMDANKQLCFDAYLYDSALEEHSLDFGEWLYIKDRGFFSKYDLQMGLPISPNVKIPFLEIPEFISEHKDKLELIPGFFAKESPIDKIGLKVFLKESEEILVEPKIRYKEGYGEENVLLLGVYSYVEKEGFYELPEIHRLDKNYQKAILITKDRIGSFLNYEWVKIESKIIDIDPRLKRPEALRLKLNSMEKDLSEGHISWIVDLSYRSEQGSISIADIKRTPPKQQFIFSAAGLIDLQAPRYFWIHQIKRKPKKESKLGLSTLEWLRLSVYEEIDPPMGDSSEAVNTRKALKEIENLETDQFLNLSELKSRLRPYQESGVKWLWFLYCHDLSGLLCDEMGLGKTHQTMALMAASSSMIQEKYLVVCPTSVIYHWQNLLETFLPHLRVLVYHGQSRTIQDFSSSYDILLTSYGILRTGRDPIHQIDFGIAVFDEVQNAKNALSQTHQSLRSINTRFRLGLTGTPIENTLKELKALLDLVLPNYLPGEKEFQARFIQPIEKLRDDTQQKLLSNLIRPFILRRKKKDVLKDLPEKIEGVRLCELSDDQKKLYQEVLDQSKANMLKTLEDPNQSIDYLHVFAMLSKLKQVCNHPSMILKDVSNYQSYESGKWELFLELLSEARESEQKIVVFSQYLDMIQIIESYLRQNQIGFAAIKGSTRDRKEQIMRFHDDPKCEVFVGSLLAAGVGIDLTCASVVIHYDRWWNPAKENQATDRVHRIGQNRGVQVFKLVTKNTVEEDIHAMIEKKQGLIEDTLGSSDIDQVKLLTREELINILKRSAL